MKLFRMSHLLVEDTRKHNSFLLVHVFAPRVNFSQPFPRHLPHLWSIGTSSVYLFLDVYINESHRPCLRWIRCLTSSFEARKAENNAMIENCGVHVLGVT